MTRMCTPFHWGLRSSVGLLLLAASVLAGDLPPDARRAVDNRCHGWRPAPVAPQIEEWFRQDQRSLHPNRIEGDFNADGRRDFALEVICEGRQRVFALISRAEGFEVHALADDPADPFTFLVLYRKGEKDFDFETMKPFRYATDALGLLYFDRTAVTFRWIGKAFEKRAAPGDEEVEAARQ